MKSKLELNPKFWSSKLETEEKKNRKEKFNSENILLSTIPFWCRLYKTPPTSLRLNTAWAGAQGVGERGTASANFHARGIIWDICIQMIPCHSAQVCTSSPEKKRMNLHLNFIKDCNYQLQVQIYGVLPLHIQQLNPRSWHNNQLLGLKVL